jgi:hypothetical protein
VPYLDPCPYLEKPALINRQWVIALWSDKATPTEPVITHRLTQAYCVYLQQPESHKSDSNVRLVLQKERQRHSKIESYHPPPPSSDS